MEIYLVFFGNIVYHGIMTAESLSWPQDWVHQEYPSASLTLVPTFATKVSNTISIAKSTTWWLSGWLPMIWIPYFFLSNESARNILEQAPISAGIPVFMAVVAGLLAAGTWVKSLDTRLADIRGHEPLFTRVIRQIRDRDLKKFSVNGEDRVTLLLPINIVDLEWRFLTGKIDWYQSWSGVLAETDEFIRSTWEYLWFFPKEILEKYLKKIVVYNSDRRIEWEENDYEKIILSLPESLQELIKSKGKDRAKKSKSTYGWMAYGDRKIFVISTQNTKEDVPETVFHEMTHLMLMHFANRHFQIRWENTFWVRQEDQSEYAPHKFIIDEINYGVIDAAEDMSTIGQYMFSKEWWRTLDTAIALNKKIWKRPGILYAKVQAMITLFESQSKWLMDREFFRRAQSGDLQSWEGTQDYFDNKRRVNEK